MIYKISSVLDAVSGEFSDIACEVDESQAYRRFGSAVQSARDRQVGLLYTDPDDFSLWIIGEFDSETGDIRSCKHLRICEAGEF